MFFTYWGFFEGLAFPARLLKGWAGAWCGCAAAVAVPTRGHSPSGGAAALETRTSKLCWLGFSLVFLLSLTDARLKTVNELRVSS